MADRELYGLSYVLNPTQTVHWVAAHREAQLHSVGNRREMLRICKRMYVTLMLTVAGECRIAGRICTYIGIHMLIRV